MDATTEKEENVIRMRTLEIRQSALEDRQDSLNHQFEQVLEMLTRNTDATMKLAADNAVVREWVENWKAGMRVAQFFGSLADGPLGKITKWIAGVVGGLGASYIAWKQTRGH